jgi:hypothetical protein
MSFLVLIGVVVVLCIIGSLTGTHTQPTQSTDTSAGSADDSNSSGSSPATAPPRMHMVFKQAGSGTATTAKFDVSEDWDLVWSYNCTSNGENTGNFIVNVNGGDEMGTNQLGAKDDGTEHFHTGPGTRYLEINSECDWVVEVMSY